MSQRVVLPFYLTIVATVLTLILSVPLAFSQHGSEGTVSVSVLDPSGSIVPGADLELRDLSTNTVSRGQTTQNGTYTFDPAQSLITFHGGSMDGNAASYDGRVIHIYNEKRTRTVIDCD